MNTQRPIPIITFAHNAIRNIALAYGIDPRTFIYVRDEYQLRGTPVGTVVMVYDPSGVSLTEEQYRAIKIALARGCKIEHHDDIHTIPKDGAQKFAMTVFDYGVGDGPDPMVDRIQRRVDEAEANILRTWGLAVPKIDLDARRIRAWQQHIDREVELRLYERYVWRTMSHQHYDLTPCIEQMDKRGLTYTVTAPCREAGYW